VRCTGVSRCPHDRGELAELVLFLFLGAALVAALLALALFALAPLLVARLVLTRRIPARSLIAALSELSGLLTTTHLILLSRPPS
jgi:hypothetical protein